jgi:hypothetical protein
MAAIITNYYRLFNAKQFVESVKEPFVGSDANANTIHYVFIGRPQEWDNENLPPTPVDTTNLQFDVWKDMIAMKKVTAEDVSHVIPREDWVSGTVYDEYDHEISSTSPAYSGATSLFLSNFYVMTDEYKVYKCLFNNNNSASTIKPTSTSTVAVTLSDGYVWKYMYTIDTDKILKFLTPEFMPVVACSTVQAAAVDGAIDVIKITYAGNTYASTPNVVITGDGNVQANAVATLSGAVVGNVTVTARGTNYRYANISIVGGAPAANATARAIIGPPGGHGANPVDELGGYYIMVTSKLTYNEGAGDFPVVNDFRRIGMIVDPINYATSNTRSTANTLSATWSITTANTTAAFAIDEIITGGTSGANAKILSTSDPVVAGNSITRFIQPLIDPDTNHKMFVVGETITGANSGSTGDVTLVSGPEVKQGSGTIIYVDNRKTISRAADQAESIHIVVEF